MKNECHFPKCVSPQKLHETVMKQQTLAFKEQVQSELLVVGECPFVCIYAQMLFTNKLWLFQKDLAPDFGVFGFVNWSLSKVANSLKNLSIPLNLTLLSQLHTAHFSMGWRTCFQPSLENTGGKSPLQLTDRDWYFECVCAPMYLSASENTALPAAWMPALKSE